MSYIRVPVYIILLEIAKENVKSAFRQVDANPVDPAAVALVRAIDALDVAIKAVRERESVGK